MLLNPTTKVLGPSMSFFKGVHQHDGFATFSLDSPTSCAHKYDEWVIVFPILDLYYIKEF